MQVKDLFIMGNNKTFIRSRSIKPQANKKVFILVVVLDHHPPTTARLYNSTAECVIHFLVQALVISRLDRQIKMLDGFYVLHLKWI